MEMYHQLVSNIYDDDLFQWTVFCVWQFHKTFAQFSPCAPLKPFYGYIPNIKNSLSFLVWTLIWTNRYKIRYRIVKQHTQTHTQIDWEFCRFTNTRSLDCFFPWKWYAHSQHNRVINNFFDCFSLFVNTLLFLSASEWPRIH